MTPVINTDHVRVRDNTVDEDYKGLLGYNIERLCPGCARGPPLMSPRTVCTGVPDRGGPQTRIDGDFFFFLI